MSEVTIYPRRGTNTTRNGEQAKNGRNSGRRPNYNAIHKNALPVVVHPLPVLIPHNPLSIVAIALSYLLQVIIPPQRKLYKGYFSSATSSIHITDEETQRALWEQGFFGRGSLSRSEPTWLQNQQRLGQTAEENTRNRREERRQFKLDRAKAEIVEIDNDLASTNDVEVSADTATRSVPQQNKLDTVKTNEHDFGGIAGILKSPVTSAQSDTEEHPAPLRLLNIKHEAFADAERLAPTSDPQSNSHIAGFDEWRQSVDVNGLPTPPPTSTSSEVSQSEHHGRPTKRLVRQKTVRFSPTIEAREFDLSSPVISPIKAPGSITADITINDAVPASALISSSTIPEQTTKTQEHLHVSLEEAFFLVYSLGVLEVYPSSDGDEALSATSLFSLFRRHSYFPPKSLSIRPEFDDPFLLSYAVYHHFRSMGWIVRSGVKFGVDYLLYNRGPAFSHAEFAVIVMPSYKDERERDSKTWWWLHGINRVQAQVHKSLILSYVDIPDTPPTPVSNGADIGDLLSQYKIRNINIKRWTPNRSRD